MKKLLVILSVLFLSSCSSIRVIDSWKNDEVLFFKPQKLLVIGVTNNLTARKTFEENLKNEFVKRNIKAYESTEVFNVSFTDSKKTEEEINTLIAELSEKGFDAVIITVVKGVDEKSNYSGGYYTVNYHWKRFGRYYYRFQDIYYNPGYYNEFKIYHVETSIYNINQEEPKSLIWVGALDLVDPQSIRGTVNEYIATIIRQLERDKIIIQH